MRFWQEVMAKGLARFSKRSSKALARGSGKGLAKFNKGLARFSKV